MHQREFDLLSSLLENLRKLCETDANDYMTVFCYCQRMALCAPIDKTILIDMIFCLKQASRVSPLGTTREICYEVL